MGTPLEPSALGVSATMPDYQDPAPEAHRGGGHLAGVRGGHTEHGGHVHGHGRHGGVQHAYRVKAINAAGAGPVSNFVNVTP